MFEHPHFDVYEYHDIPLNQDCYLIDEKYIQEFECSLLELFDSEDCQSVGYISNIAVRHIHQNSMQLSWFANVYDRFHEIAITLPKQEFVSCVGCWRWDYRPHIFVKSEWLDNIHLRLYSVFCLIDAIGVTEALQNGVLTREKLLLLREEIDELAKGYPDVSFISFADSTILKSNWTIGHVRDGMKYTYKPEILVSIAKAFQSIYQRVLGLDSYAILTQGSNEYYEDPLLHISKTNNHICLNSLGLPFAELLSIENSVRLSLKKKLHEPSELYMDESFYNSLRLDYDFKQKARNRNGYRAKMSKSDSFYYYDQCDNILNHLK